MDQVRVTLLWCHLFDVTTGRGTGGQTRRTSFLNVICRQTKKMAEIVPTPKQGDR